MWTFLKMTEAKIYMNYIYKVVGLYSSIEDSTAQTELY